MQSTVIFSKQPILTHSMPHSRPWGSYILRAGAVPRVLRQQQHQLQQHQRQRRTLQHQTPVTTTRKTHTATSTSRPTNTATTTTQHYKRPLATCLRGASGTPVQYSHRIVTSTYENLYTNLSLSLLSSSWEGLTELILCFANVLKRTAKSIFFVNTLKRILKFIFLIHANLCAEGSAGFREIRIYDF